MVVAELYLNHQMYEPPISTGVLSNYKLNQYIEFPIRYCDLTPNTHVALTIYDMSRLEEQAPLASTVIDVFDSKQRLRQGTFDLLLWKDVKPDMSFECKTPGLIEDMMDDDYCRLSGKDAKHKQDSIENFKRINDLLQRVNFYEKKIAPEDNKQWIDQHCWEAIYQDQLHLH